MISFDEAFASMPMVAILRGLRPAQALEVGRILFEASFRIIEVPLNSPEPFDSIACLAEAYGERAVIGAGTVLDPAAVERTQDAGGRLVVMPHGDPAVIRAAKARGLVCCPGVATPTEAFAALEAGADALKLFPAETIPPAALGALRAVLPAGTRLLPVGGILPESLAAYRAAGAAGFGLGSALFKPERPSEALRERAEAFVRAWSSVN
ncbi:MAG: 2-dehydro-3-deoxy-6-phosphogalactonate aldolase [Kiloniellales bacterium]|nr:2-dehydro-3-deoxy-6-phosphogalactonate aldolase [Kiloniellales bacterium]